MTEMTIEEARRLVAECRESLCYIDDMLCCGKLTIDGDFTLQDLKAVVLLIEAGEIPEAGEDK